MVLSCARKKLQKKIDTKNKKRLNTKIIRVNNVGFFVSPRFQLDAVSNQSDELPELRPMIDIPIEPSGDDLRTINQGVLSSLCTEQPGADSPVDQAVASCVLDVGEELIGTCVTPTKVRTVQQTLVRSNLEYCSVVWSPYTKRNTDKLERVQNWKEYREERPNLS